MKTYKIQRPYLLGNSLILVFPITLVLINLLEGQGATMREWCGVGIFFLISLILTLVPFSARIEVGDNYVKNYLFGFLTRKLNAANVEVIEYGNLFRGGLGYGKGLKVWERTERGKRYYSLAERAYGREAIEHVRQVLTRGKREM